MMTYGMMNYEKRHFVLLSVLDHRSSVFQVFD